jgi:hypothetical protein
MIFEIRPNKKPQKIIKVPVIFTVKFLGYKFNNYEKITDIPDEAYTFRIYVDIDEYYIFMNSSTYKDIDNAKEVIVEKAKNTQEYKIASEDAIRKYTYKYGFAALPKEYEIIADVLLNEWDVIRK